MSHRGDPGAGGRVPGRSPGSSCPLQGRARGSGAPGVLEAPQLVLTRSQARGPVLGVRVCPLQQKRETRRAGGGRPCPCPERPVSCKRQDWEPQAGLTFPGRAASEGGSPLPRPHPLLHTCRGTLGATRAGVGCPRSGGPPTTWETTRVPRGGGTAEGAGDPHSPVSGRLHSLAWRALDHASWGEATVSPPGVGLCPWS